MRERLEKARPSTLLLILMVTIPLLVVVAGGVSVLLFRTGYGLLVALAVPSLALSAAVVVLGVLLGRAASSRARQEDIERRGRKKRG
jgi:hypothetical protein